VSRVVQLTRAASSDLDRLAATDRASVLHDLRTLADAPIGPPPRIKRLKGLGFPLYRLRSGGFRALYRIDGPVVTIMRVIDRRDLERTLRRLLTG
jgi:mRNA-degrading endonuclease RelE of RelBE toxin-antitoxin system